MTIKIFNTVCLAFFLGVLLGCQPNLTDNYLLQNPEELQQKYDHCRFDASSTCDPIRRAMQDFNRLLNEQTMAPNQFGKNIMHLQQQIVALEKEAEQARDQQDEVKLKLLMQASDDAEQELKILYAVVRKMIME